MTTNLFLNRTRWLHSAFCTLILLFSLGVGNAWGTTTYKLTAVTSVSANNKYVFVEDGYALKGTTSSSALQTTSSYNTTGLAGNEVYVWTLSSSTNGYYIANCSIATNNYLKNGSSTGVSLVASSNTPSEWTFSWLAGKANLINYSNSNRYLGEVSNNSHTFKAYSESGHAKDFTVYVLEEESDCDNPGTALSVGASPTTIYTNGTSTLSPSGGNGSTITYSVTSDNSTYATIVGTTFSATRPGTYTVQASQSESGGTCGGTATVNITVRYQVKWSVNNDDSYNTGSPTTYIGTHNTKVATLPTSPASGLCDGSKVFVGWTATPIVGTTNTIPSDLFTTAAGSPNVTDNVTFYAVFATQGTATFQASDITNTPATGNTREWGHTASGTLLYISNGQYYTGGSPYTWTVNSGTSNYARFTAGSGKTITQIVVTISGTNYKINSVTKGTLSTSSTTQTITGINNSTVDCKATSSYQIRITQAVVTYASAFATSCCTKLGSINGSVSLTQGGNSVTISGWSDVSNVGTYTVKMYKKNGASWDPVSGTASGGSAGTAGTRTGITSGSKSVTYTGLTVESEYKFTVQAIAGSAAFCDGDETAVTEINSTDVSSTPFKFRYAIYIDDGTNDNYEYHYITPTGNTDEGSVDIDLNAHVDYYQFKIAGGFSGWWGQTGTDGKIEATTVSDWTLNGSYNVRLKTGAAGDYVFTVDYSGTTNPKVGVEYPSADQDAGYVIYYDNSILNWSSLYYRIGNNSNCSKVDAVLVTGTDKFYKITTPDYDNMDAWHIANNYGWTGSNSVYRTKTNSTPAEAAKAITNSISFQQYVVTGDITVIPTTTHSTGGDTGDAGNNNCEFYTINTPTSGMLTHTATITPPSNGTINLAYTNTSGTSCPTNTSTVSNLAHRTILTATANPSTGYQLSTFTVTPSGESAQNISSGDNHILAKDATFAATFSAKTYSISLDRNGGTTGATGVTMTYNSSSFIGWSAPTRTGYTFDGYYTSETDDNGSGTLVINSSGVLQANVDGYTGANGIWTKDATCTLYAKWTANTTTVTLTAGTGTNGSASIKYDATSYESFSAAVRVGYTCTGYWTNSGGTGTKILNANGSFAASTISGYVTSDKWSYTTASTLTLYAGWTNTYAGYAFDLLEDVRDISAGSKIILIGTNAAGDTYKAMTTTQNENNRGSVAAGSGEFVMSNSNKTATLGASTSVQVITLEDLATPADNTYQFNVENGYLYAAGTTNARLKTQTPNSAYGHWLVAVDANTKKATMTGQGGNSYNKIYFNSSSSIFSGYNSAQQPTYIYYKETRTKYTITWDKNGHGTAPTYPTNAARVTMPDISVTGYTNAGWIADKAVTNVSSGATINAGTLIPKDTRVQLSANTTFTAQWTTDVYTISATLTNITVSSAFPSALTYTGETTTDLDRTLSVTSAYVLPTNLTVTMGGNACTNGTEYTYDSSTGEFTFIVAVTGNIVITGTALNKYTITLNPGNGSLSEGGGWSADGDNLVQVVVEGNNVTLPTPTPSCAGWVFKGWKLGSAANNQSSFTPDKADGATFAPNATSTYYAVYRASTPTGTTYTKITDEAELTTGDYLIVGYPGSSYYYAMGNSITSGHMTETSSTNATSWSSPSAGYVWTIIKAGDKVGFYNANASKYLTIVDGAWVLNSTDGQKFSYSFNSTTKAWTFTSPSGKQMIYNSYFYTGDAQSSAIYLYKRGNTESGNYYTSPDCSSLTVTGVSDPVGAATVHLSSTTAKDGDVIWVTYTLNRGYTFDSWSKSGTGASLSSTSAEFTKLTVGSTAPTVTANCDALTSYTLNYHDGDGSHTMTVYEGEKILEVLPEPSESCDGTSTTLMGWSTSEIRTKTDDAPTYVSASAVVNSTTAASTYYAVYAKEETPDGTLSILGSLGSSFWGASYNSNDKEIDDSNDNTITLNTDNVIFQNPSSNPTVQIKNASGAGIWNDTELPGSITQIKVKAYTAGLKLYVGTSKKPTSTNEKTISSTSEQTYDFDASDGLTYFSVFSNSATPQITSIIITYTGEYGDYITTCCDAAELEFTTSVYENQIRQDLAGNVGSGNKFELEIPFTTSSTSTTYTTAVKKLTGGDKRSESDAAGTAVDGVGGHASVTVDAVNKKITLQVWSTNPGSNFTGQGTYRVKLTQESNATYCEGVDYVFVDIVMRDKFVDNVNGNVTINKDGTGSALTAPAESDMDVEKDDDCGGQTRRLLGWIKETDLQTIYGNDGETGYLDDAAKYEANKSKIKAPGASITTSAVTWYAVWGIDNTPAP